jgi:hypothetical protein
MRLFIWALVIELIIAGAMIPGGNTVVSKNAALRYWAAFSEIQDSPIAAEQGKEITAILAGKIPYDDGKFSDLLTRNRLALETMQRGTALPVCDWGIDYELGKDASAEYVRDALVLGRLNLLLVFHQLKSSNNEAAVNAMVAGIRFSRDVANGGTIFAAIVAKSLLVDHLRATSRFLEVATPNSQERSRLRAAISSLGEGLDWKAAARQEFEILRPNYVNNPRGMAAFERVESAYVTRLGSAPDRGAVDTEVLPKELAQTFPKVEGLQKQKRELSDVISQVNKALSNEPRIIR